MVALHIIKTLLPICCLLNSSEGVLKFNFSTAALKKLFLSHDKDQRIWFPGPK
jgi:hypothetical protein